MAITRRPQCAKSDFLTTALVSMIILVIALSFGACRKSSPPSSTLPAGYSIEYEMWHGRLMYRIVGPKGLTINDTHATPAETLLSFGASGDYIAMVIANIDGSVPSRFIIADIHTNRIVSEFDAKQDLEREWERLVGAGLILRQPY